MSIIQMSICMILFNLFHLFEIKGQISITYLKKLWKMVKKYFCYTDQYLLAGYVKNQHSTKNVIQNLRNMRENKLFTVTSCSTNHSSPPSICKGCPKTFIWDNNFLFVLSVLLPSFFIMKIEPFIHRRWYILK